MQAPAAPGAAQAPAARAPGAARQVGRIQHRAEGRQWYVVFGVPAGYEDLLGLHFCYWVELAPKLPGGRLIGSRVQDCKRFATGLEASQYFWRRVDQGLTNDLGYGGTPVHFYG